MAMQFIYRINQEIAQYKYKIIYGSGIAAIELYMSITEQGETIDFFCDKEKFPVGKKLLNREIITPEKASEFGDDVCMIVCEEYVPEVINDLEKLGIRHIYVS